MNDYKINWPGVIILVLTIVMIFALGVAVGLLVNDAGTVSEMQTLILLLIGAGFGISATGYALKGSKGGTDER
ncbi:hypothetical protein [Trueperella pyogenes]|uniref:hypothetical protein n=1 Tax=Trueperella pyogenes TaxID=1661 RepID=UPI00043ADDF3|nr:hypothetical protein [Trueperella pyogenes]AHU90393.1 hypothetical protein CQ11_01405 [Trueperella pyogenes]AWA42782.1 hypothetical protein DBV13_01400 [Trueperella pyogenes]AZR03303.1 hypothetical protein EB775_08325 [Trueperella pyogenes]WHU59276.1 hypothetical protein QEV21_01205 [Trueperella pyogenes]